MKFNFDFSFRKILSNKKVVIALSVVLAFVFWLAIVTGETPTIERTITMVPITLETEGSIAGELALDEFSGVTKQSVSVKLSGPAYILNQLSPNDITVSASVAEVTKPGEYQLTLFANKKSFSSEYTIVSITPSVVTAVFDKKVEVEKEVVAKVSGVSPAEGLLVSEPIISDAVNKKITISGPQAEVEKISSVVAVAETTDVLSETKTYDGVIKLYDENNKELDKSNYTLSATTVKISQPILKSKTVPIVPTYINAPDGYNSKAIASTLSVTELSIAGPAQVIDSITSIQLSPINFNEISRQKNTFEASLVIPNGVTVIDNIETVTVKITLDNFSEKNFNITKVVPTGNASSYTVKLKSSVKNVKICGPENVIKSIKAEDLYVVVDLTDKKKGDEYIATAVIKSSKYADVWAVGTYQVSFIVG